MARYFLEVMYDGTAFNGSQIQDNAPSVQQHVNKALSTILRSPVATWGASRTDAQVHALCNFYHFNYDEAINAEKLIYKLNAILPKQIAAIRLYKTQHEEVNARFDAISRRYRYRTYSFKNPFLEQKAYYYPFTIDVNILQECAKALFDYTHFEAFSKRNAQVYTFNCRIMQSYWLEKDGEWQYIVEANRFLRGMVRGLVGTQLYIARNHKTVDDFRRIIESNDCSNAIFSVPGYGLYLEKITYPQELLIPL